jgi:hypothetical protein
MMSNSCRETASKDTLPSTHEIWSTHHSIRLYFDAVNLQKCFLVVKENFWKKIIFFSKESFV